MVVSLGLTKEMWSLDPFLTDSSSQIIGMRCWKIPELQGRFVAVQITSPILFEAGSFEWDPLPSGFATVGY